MKRILVACGAGVATSTAVIHKLSKLLDDNGFKGQYTLIQCKVTEVPAKSQDADLCVATTMAGEVHCPFVSGIAFLTGRGLEAVEKEIIHQLS